MKKVLIVVVLLLLLGGGYYYMTSKGMLPKTPQGSVTTGTQSNSGTNVFTSIKDALSKSLSLKCVYKDEQGKETTTYIKGGAVRVMMQAGTDVSQPNNIVMKDLKMHMWSDASKTGFVLTLKQPEKVSPVVNNGTAGSSNQQEESVLATIEKYKNSCKTEVVADSMFSVPTDVKFQDMEALQRQMLGK